MYYVYAIYNKEHDKIYVGQTNNIQRRLLQHNSKVLNKGHYTSKFSGPWEIFYQEGVDDRSTAIAREKGLKSHQGRIFLQEKLNNSEN
ncbi:MAG: GIY-YIG nuclease family protein [bacterium]